MPGRTARRPSGLVQHRPLTSSVSVLRSGVPRTVGPRRWFTTGEPGKSDKPTDKKADDDDMVFDEKPKATAPGEEGEKKKQKKLIEETEKVKGTATKHGFQTETKQLLDIVARSLYTEKEIFIRELISNASDALEKLRHVRLTAAADLEPSDVEPMIMLSVDDEKKTFTIQDTGIGMNKEELMSHLGTIARSGSKAFMQKLNEGKVASEAAEQIIGQFGVGFYSVFMCATKVKVYSRSALKGSTGYLWESDGSGDYSLSEADNVAIGTKVIANLKDVESQFASQNVIERIIKKYSNFIGFPITLNGDRVNTVEALWRKEAKKVTEEEHEQFFKFISNGWEKPMYKLHYKVDAPISINSLFYVGQSHSEKYGVARLEPNVNLYCRKVLIKAKAKDVIPEWLRFIHGVVDSEDLPLNISRESTQDSAQIRKLNGVLTSRLIKWFDENSKKDPSQYDKFFKEFGNFIKEGACMDAVHRPDIAKLLRFESSKKEKGELVSFDEYIERMPEGQEKIYFLFHPSRETALTSPYYEQFKKKGIEVLFLHGNIDEYVMTHVEQYKKHRLYSIENPDLDLDKIKATEEAKEEAVKDMDDILVKELSDPQCKKLSEWLMRTLPEKLFDAKATTRLSSSPAVVVTGHEQASLHRMMKQMSLMQGKSTSDSPLMKQNLEFNPKHVIIKKLYWLSRRNDPASISRAKHMAEQVFDNALIAAGLLEDPRAMLGRLNKLLESALGDVTEEKEEDPPAPSSPAGATTAGSTSSATTSSPSPPPPTEETKK